MFAFHQLAATYPDLVMKSNHILSRIKKPVIEMRDDP